MPAKFEITAVSKKALGKEATAASEMSIVNVTNVVVLDNPTAFRNPLTFEVTFECLEALDAGKKGTDG